MAARAPPGNPTMVAGTAPTPSPAASDVAPEFLAGGGRVLILGGGYAGVATARALLRKGHPAEKIDLVDREPTTTFRTELYKVGEAVKGPEIVPPWTVPFDRTGLTSAGVRVHEGEATAIDLDARVVRVGAQDLPYNVLVLALGSVPAYYGIPGCRENSEEIYTVQGARHLASSLRDLLPATVGVTPLRVLIAGGGATGVELGAYIHTAPWSELLGAPTRPLLTTVLSGPAPFLAGLPGPLVARARREVVKAGVEVVDGGQVTRVLPGRVEFKDLPPRDTDLFVWCGGLRAPDVVASLPVPHGPAKRVIATPFLEVEGRPGVFALGDCAALVDPYDGTPVPSTAQAALKQAPVAAHNVLARLKGSRFDIFHYRSSGVAVSVGQGKAVAAVGQRVVGGRLAGAIKGFVEKEYHAGVRGVTT